MSTRIVLARHATCAHMDSLLFGRTIDAPLDPAGERQARSLASALSARQERAGADAPGLQIEASPRRRTRQTAAAISATFGNEVRIVPEIDEIDFGSWGGRSFATLAQDPAWQHWNEHRSQASTPAGETIAAVQARAMRHLLALELESAAGTIVLVTHAEIIRAVVLYCLGAPSERCRALDIDPASLTTLRLHHGELTIQAVNESVTA